MITGDPNDPMDEGLAGDAMATMMVAATQAATIADLLD